MFPVCALQQLEGGRALSSIRFSTYRYGVRRQGTVHIERDDDLQCTKGYTPPPHGPQKGEGETASPLPCVCWASSWHVSGISGTRTLTSSSSRREIFPRIPTGRVLPFKGWFGALFCRLSFFFLPSRSGRHESMETGRTGEVTRRSQLLPCRCCWWCGSK